MILRHQCGLTIILVILANSAMTVHSDVLETRIKRQAVDPIPHLDQLINHLIYKVPQLLDESVVASEKVLRYTVAKRVTQGWSIVWASIFDITSDYILNERTLGNIKGDMTVIYNWMFIFGYGIGFGFPLLLGLPDDTKDCGGVDFSNTLAEYQLDQGVTPLLDRGATIDDLRSVITEFQSVVGTKLFCIDGSENIASQKAVNGINNLITAMGARLDAEEALAQSDSEEEDDIRRRAFLTTNKLVTRSSRLSNPKVKDFSRRYKPVSKQLKKRTGFERRSTTISGDVVVGARDLDSRIETTLSIVKDKIPTAIESVEKDIALANRDRVILALSNFLGSFFGALSAAGIVTNWDEVSAGNRLQIIAQLMYGYGYWGPFALEYETARVDCNLEDLEKAIYEYGYVSDYKRSTADPLIASYYVTEYNGKIKENLYCLIQRSSQNQAANELDTYIDVYTNLLSEKYASL